MGCNNQLTIVNSAMGLENAAIACAAISEFGLRAWDAEEAASRSWWHILFQVSAGILIQDISRSHWMLWTNTFFSAGTGLSRASNPP